MMGQKLLAKVAFLTAMLFTLNVLPLDLNLQKKEEDTLLKARQLVQDGDLEGAVNELQRIIAVLLDNPAERERLAEAYYLLAKVYYTAGDHELMERHLRNVFTTDRAFTTFEPDLYFKEIVDRILSEFPDITRPKQPEPEESSSGTNIISKEKKKKRKPPVLLILGGIAVITTLILLFAKKKKPDTKTGSIRIMSNPSGADISLDGNKTSQKTPYTLNFVPVGPHTIRLEKTGFEVYEKTVIVEANKEERISATLETFWSGVEWIQIPAGSFKMGDSYMIGTPDELPVHEVYLNTFYISRYEITFQQFDRFCEETGRGKPSDNGWGRDSRPIIFVSYSNAQSYCQWLSEKTGMDILLPTEAQWEKAAQGTLPRIYPWGNGEPDCSRSNFRGCNGMTMPVGSAPAGQSPYGIHDLAGNVWEWCGDWYSEDYYSNPEATGDNPTGPDYGTTRVVRGGSWGMMGNALRCSNRRGESPNYSSYALGFRVISTTPPAGQNKASRTGR